MSGNPEQLKSGTQTTPDHEKKDPMSTSRLVSCRVVYVFKRCLRTRLCCMYVIYRRGEEAGRTDYRAEEGELGDHGRCYRGEFSAIENRELWVTKGRPRGRGGGSEKWKDSPCRFSRFIQECLPLERKTLVVLASISIVRRRRH
jgi:broad specificity phosphatase PhoE